MDWMHWESTAYWIVFIGAFFGVALWESAAAISQTSAPAELRWSRHGVVLMVVAATNTLVLRLSPVLMAAGAQRNPYGVFHLISLPFPVVFVLSIFLLDLVHYAAHWFVHAVPLLWRFHEIHHSDPDYDVSTAGRFHPLDASLRHGIYLVAVYLLSPPLSSVFLSEMLVAGGNFFVHANCALPRGVETALRRLCITPTLHRIHHSLEVSAQNLNFGQTFSLWDQALGTYRGSSPGEPPTVTGIMKAEKEPLSLSYLLLSPFVRGK